MIMFSSDHADKYSYGVVRHFVGHGVGRVFHADPVVQHFSNRPDFELSSVISFHILCGNNDGGRMMLNQTFTIEPMLTIGSVNPVMWDDNWTVVTEDGSLSAQFEHTILITKDGAEILTHILPCLSVSMNPRASCLVLPSLENVLEKF
ncbi:methionine aminopeptidase 1D [Populus alba x Populus x berolinensis]|uniref:Methionine aminopeptidase 1D n=1 Tax=Populus alba x Populus x berolinensis TaxID=444605 RepID=A0AAD6W3H9_9ROSI|nr:methionine aminopeptidase 1D [Populus alba x Populus x berolinensis]